MKKAVISFSGGMDSTGLLIYLLHNNYDIKAISFNYGQKHLIEIEKGKELISYLNSKGYKIDHNIIELKGLSGLLNSNLVSGGEEVPEGHYEDENMKKTVVPNRNKIMSSIIQSVALSWANLTNTKVSIAMGIHSGDHEIYPDCREEFRDADYNAFRLGNWDSEKVIICTPFLKYDKYYILKSSLKYCKALKLDFNEVFKRTNTSYKPIKGNSDYKSASSVERIEAFIKLGKKDPVTYADETGVVPWDTVVKYVKQVLF